jgi:hypothetical protein
MKIKTDLKAGLTGGCGCGASPRARHNPMPTGFVHSK